MVQLNAFRDLDIAWWAVRHKVHLKPLLAQPRHGVSSNEAAAARYEYRRHLRKSAYD
jgi:hypothetical protein